MAASKHRRGVRYEAVWGSTSDIVGNYLLRSSLDTIRNHWKDTRRSSAKIGQIQKETDLLRKIYNFDNVDQDDIVVIAYW